MSYVTLTEAKKQCNISSNDDDDFLTSQIIPAAEEAVALEVCEDLSNLEDSNCVLPYALKQAILVKVADFYANRESESFGTPSSIKATSNLIGLYRNYNN